MLKTEDLRNWQKDAATKCLLLGRFLHLLGLHAAHHAVLLAERGDALVEHGAPPLQQPLCMALWVAAAAVRASSETSGFSPLRVLGCCRATTRKATEPVGSTPVD